MACSSRERRLRRPRPRSSSTTRRGEIVEQAEAEVIDLLRRERARLDALADALLEKETLEQAEAYEIAGVPQPTFDAEQEAKATAAV